MGLSSRHLLGYSQDMATETRTHVGEALRRRRKELGLTLGEVARAMGTSDGYVWKLEQGLINLQNVALPRLMGLLQALRWTPEEFTMATGVALPGLTEPQEPTPGVNLLKVPVWGEKDIFLVLGLPGEAPSPRDLRALRVPEGYLVFREGTPPEHGENAVATGPGGETEAGRFLGYTARRSYALETRKGVLVLEKADWELHRVVVEVRLYPDEE